MRIDSTNGGPQGDAGRGHPRDAQKSAPSAEYGTLSVLHDVRNLLLVIYSRSAELKTLLPAGDEAARVLDDLHDSIQCAVRVATAELGAEERTNVSQLLSSLAPVLSGSLPDSVRLTIDNAPESDVWVRADQVALTRALLNLSTNAGTAMADGGRLDVSLSVLETKEGVPATPRELVPGTYAKIAVRDTGSGMSEERLERTRAGNGTNDDGRNGRGLDIVADTMGRLRGGMLLHSEVGAGTTVELLVPIDETRPGS